MCLLFVSRLYVCMYVWTVTVWCAIAMHIFVQSTKDSTSCVLKCVFDLVQRSWRVCGEVLYCLAFHHVGVASSFVVKFIFGMRVSSFAWNMMRTAHFVWRWVQQLLHDDHSVCKTFASANLDDTGVSLRLAREVVLIRPVQPSSTAGVRFPGGEPYQSQAPRRVVLVILVVYPRDKEGSWLASISTH